MIMRREATCSRDWWRTGVIYQIYPRSFRDGNGDGIGDLFGVMEQLPYLSETLGIDAIWLCPFYPSPMRDGGYDISDFTNVDPTFGDLATFRCLLTEAHRHGLKVLIDYVPNHTSDQHPWFVASRSSRSNPLRDWYIWRNPGPNGSAPNNWVEETGNSVWECDERTGQYYLHSHYVSQPDLNWRNPRVRAAMVDVLRFWLDLGVDGFRIDVPHMIMKDPQLRDNPPNPHPQANPYDRQHPLFHTQLHMYDRQHSDLHEVYREIRTVLDSYNSEYDHVMMGETEVCAWETWLRYYGQDQDEFHLPFHFQLIETPWQAGAIRSFVETFEQNLPQGAWPNYVLGNHDRPRVATRCGTEAVRVAAMLLLTLRGTPTLYYGEELGMPDVPITPQQQQDPLGRDPTRAPMLWNTEPHAGFCPPQARPWLPVPSDYRAINVAMQLSAAHSTLNLYRRLIAYRRTSEALRTGTYRSLSLPQDECYVYLREGNGQRVLVALNLSAQEQVVSLSDLPEGWVAISTELDRQEAIDPNRLLLRKHEGLLVELRG